MLKDQAEKPIAARSCTQVTNYMAVPHRTALFRTHLGILTSSGHLRTVGKHVYALYSSRLSIFNITTLEKPSNATHTLAVLVVPCSNSSNTRAMSCYLQHRRTILVKRFIVVRTTGFASDDSCPSSRTEAYNGTR